MSRQIGSLNHEELIGVLVAITVQLFFLIPQKSLLVEIGAESVHSCPLCFILFSHDWQMFAQLKECRKWLASIGAFLIHIIQPLAIFYFW